MADTNNQQNIWRAINQAGSIEKYIHNQLVERGFLVEKQDTDGMSKREFEQYKKSLKEEAAEKKRLKKLAWQAYKSANIVHLGDNIYWNDIDDFDKWDIPDLDERASENELPKIDKPKELAQVLKISVAQLRWLTFHREAATFIHYRKFTIPKKDGSERAIWAPMPMIKAAQKWILTEILEKLPVHGAAHGFLAGRSIFTNAQQHTNSKVIVRLDLKDFFPSITFKRVKGLFRKAGYREQIAILLALICTEAPREIVMHEGKKYFVSLAQRCLPQGAPTSPAITNTLCMKLDRRLTGLAKKFGWRYTRYADDLTFSLPEIFKDKQRIGALLGAVAHIVQEEGFTVNAKKTFVARKGSKQKVTGLVVNGKKVPRVTQKLKREIRAAIHNLKNNKTKEDGWAKSQLRGYAAYIFMSEPELGAKLLTKLNEIK